MNTQRNDSAIAGQIGALFKRWSEAVRERDTDAIMACYHSDVIAFDAINQLQFKGLDAYRQHWAACLDMCPGAMVFEQHDLVVHGEGETAFAHWLNRCGVEGDKDHPQGCWMRGSAGYRLTDAGWKIIHEHFSAPFDMTSSKALLDLQPDEHRPLEAGHQGRRH